MWTPVSLTPSPVSVHDTAPPLPGAYVLSCSVVSGSFVAPWAVAR